MNTYEAKQAARRARLESASLIAGARSEAALTRARSIAGMIPFGQPILVGHHSEGRHRSDLRRHDGAMRRGIEEQQRAAELARRAAAVGKAGVSADDPDAIAKLERELAQVEKFSAVAKATNAAIKRHAKAGTEAQVAAILALNLGTSEATARKLLVPDFCGRVGVPPFALTNNAANARRIKARIADLRQRAATPARDPITGSCYTITEHKEDNRVRIEFTERQPSTVCSDLKSAGFRWTPTLGVWQRQATATAWHMARSICARLDPQEDACAVATPT